MITYNHGKYIEQAIQGVLLQVTNFPFELILSNDASTDNTHVAIQNILKDSPKNDFVKYYNHEANLGMMKNFMFAFGKCNKKYIALCEGDDYWTDPYKLQKQVDFLEANPDYAICFHRVYELTDGKELQLSTLNTSLKEKSYTIEDLALNNFIHTPSVVFRNGLIKALPVWFKKSPVGDYVLHLLNARYGKIKYIPDIMAVYRRHAEGAWSVKPHEYLYKNWLNVIEYLLNEFEGQIKINLKKQYNQTQFYLAEVYESQGQYEKSFDILSKAFCDDSTKNKEWLHNNYLPLLTQDNTLAKTIRGMLRQWIIKYKNKLLINRKIN